MALSRRMALFFLLVLVAAELGTIQAKGSTVGKDTVSSMVNEKEKEKEKEENKEKKEVKKEKKEEESNCLSQSHKFKGFCLSSETCAEVCKTEGFPTGQCKLDNATRRCFCKKPCV